MSGKLKVEIGRYGEAWEQVRVAFEDPTDFDSLEAHIKAINSQGLVTEKYQARVVDGMGTVLAYLVKPYEGVAVDIRSQASGWLDEIRADYGIGKEWFARACREWLQANGQACS